MTDTIILNARCYYCNLITTFLLFIENSSIILQLYSQECWFKMHFIEECNEMKTSVYFFHSNLQQLDTSNSKCGNR